MYIYIYTLEDTQSFSKGLNFSKNIDPFHILSFCVNSSNNDLRKI